MSEIELPGAKLNPAKEKSLVPKVLALFAYEVEETLVGLSLNEIAHIPPKFPLGTDLVHEALDAPREYN